METGRRLAADISQFVDRAETLWRDYLRLGPGKLEKTCFDGVASAAARIEAAIGQPDVARWLQQRERAPEQVEELQTRVAQLTRLARACACTPQGLSFITGEAGLIPRKDQHAAFESGLVKLRQLAEGWC